jgi:hypothetical protein
MSRSFKKVPGFIDEPSRKDKRFANKKVRKNWNISDGCNYKKLYESYNIRDWKSVFFTDFSFSNFIEENRDFYKAMCK